MYGVATSLGKAFIISGLFPALIFAVLNIYFFTEDIMNLSNFTGTIEVLFAAAVPLALILLILNTPIVKLFEGSYTISNFLLKYFYNNNVKRHEKLYQNLIKYKEEYNKTDNDIKRNALSNAIEQEWKKILPEISRRYIPIDNRRILPTRLGNAFAAIEEYPSIRYGMDGMVYWPRLVTVIPAEYADVIANEKINFDFSINLSLLSGVFAIEMLIKFIADYKQSEFLLWTILSTIFFYIFYRFSTMTVKVMGELIKSCFDVFRHEILQKMNIDIPEKIEDERSLWFRLSNYMASGEPFYYPSSRKDHAGEKKKI